MTAPAGEFTDVSAGAERTCDDGDSRYDVGDYCRNNCILVPCGLPLREYATEPTASDALFVLRAAVGAATCDERVCNVNGTGGITAADALLLLEKAVGQNVTLACPT